jgi:hypothetical protein
LPKEIKVGDNVRADGIIDDRPEVAIDVEVTRIPNENLKGSKGLEVAETVLRASVYDTDQVEETEV